MKYSRTSNKLSRKKSEIVGFNIALQKIVKEPELKNLLLLCDHSTQELGRTLSKAGNLVCMLPADPALNWLEDNFDELQTFKSIGIISNNDIDEYSLADRLGFDRTLFLSSKLAETDINKAVSRAVSYEPNDVAMADEFDDECFEILNPDQAQLPGIDLPHESVAKVIRLHYGEVTGFGASCSSGKTTYTSSIIAHAILEENEKVFWASMEMKPGVALTRLVSSISNKKINGMSGDCTDWFTKKERYLSIAECKAARKKIKNSLHFYKTKGRVRPDALMQRMEYVRRKYGIRVFVIDSLMKVVCSMAFEAQCRFRRNRPNELT